MFTIEKGIPLPDYKHDYPFIAMEIGDSFFVSDLVALKHKTPEEVKHVLHKLQSRLGNAAKTFGERNNPKRKFITRTYDNGVRIWRVE